MPETPINENNRPKHYRWPADKLTAEEMAILYELRSKTGIPINHLLKEAIRLLEVILIKSSLVQKMAGIHDPGEAVASKRVTLAAKYSSRTICHSGETSPSRDAVLRI